jgi:guanylate cyclase soluble subunit alpha
MFCRKFKDLKITGECPFSLLAPGQVPKEPTEEVAGGSEGCQATLPICQYFPEKNAEGSLPQRKTSRNRVYLHTLAESICKLIFPEVSALPLAMIVVFQNWKC